MSWLADAVLYEIYPQSFADSNGDGIGDLRGVIEHLDHLRGWASTRSGSTPASPRRSATPATTSSDYLRIAPRYGTNDDMVALVERPRAARASGSCSTSSPATPRSTTRGSSACRGRPRRRPLHLVGPARRRRLLRGRRRAAARLLPQELLRRAAGAELRLRAAPTRTSRGASRVDAAGPQANRRRCAEIIAFWLDRGIAGFRVDMAYSLVKDDPGLVETTALCGARSRDGSTTATRTRSCCPRATSRRRRTSACAPGSTPTSSSSSTRAQRRCSTTAAPGSLPWLPDHRALLLRRRRPGRARHARRLPRALGRAPAAVGAGPAASCCASADHDFSRLASGTRTAEQLGAAFTFLLTWGSIPSIYYGDEIGMRYLTGPARPRGQHLEPRLQPRRLPHPDAVGRGAAQRRLLRPPPRTRSTSRRTRPGPAHGRRPAGRPGVDCCTSCGG